jgi:hypothetical protein
MRYAFKVLVVFLFMALIIVGLTAQAHGEPVGSTQIPINWNGPITSVSWDSSSYGIAGDTIVGHSVAVPGDRVQRMAVVKNDGPSDAMVTVQILNVTTTNSSSTVNTELEEIIELYWNVNGSTGAESWKHLRLSRDPGGVSHSVSFSLAQGAQFPMTVGFSFPSSSTGGRNLGETSSLLSFEVRIIMTGDTVDSGGPGGPGSPGSGGQNSGGPGAGGSSMAAPTGGSVVASPWWLLGVLSTSSCPLVAVLLSLGGALGVTAILIRRASVAQR